MKSKLSGAWKPRASDVEWMKTMVSKLAVGGVWGYTVLPIFFKKTDEKTMVCIGGPENVPAVAEQLQRNRLTMAAAGIRFVDDRPAEDRRKM